MSVAKSVIKQMNAIRDNKNHYLHTIDFTGDSSDTNKITIPNCLEKAFSIEKAGTPIISFNTKPNQELISINRPTTFFEAVKIGHLFIENDKICTNSQRGNIILNPQQNGNVLVTTNPRHERAVATKKYVDTVARGLHLQSPVLVKTKNQLLGITHGLDKVNFYIESVNGSLIVDGIELKKNDTVLVDNNGVNDRKLMGIYEVIVNNKHKYQLKRLKQLKDKFLIQVLTGNTFANTSWAVVNNNNQLDVIKFFTDVEYIFKNIGNGATVFKRKNGSDVEFKTIKSTSNKLKVTESTHAIRLTVKEKNIDITKLKNHPKSTIVGINDNQILKNKTVDLSTTIFKNNKKQLMFDLDDREEGIVKLKIPNIDSEIMSTKDKQIVHNKTFVDTTTFFQDDFDSNKKMHFSLSNIHTGKTIRLNVPQQSTTLLGTTSKQMIKNKVIDTKTNVFAFGETEGKILTFNLSEFKEPVTLNFPSTSDTLVGTNSKQTLLNKRFSASTTSFYYDESPTKKMMFDLSKASPGVFTVLQVPKHGGEIITTHGKQELLHKTINADKNTLIGLNKAYVGLSNVNNTKNHISDKNPTNNDDSTKGFTTESRWINNRNKDEFVCINSDKNQAIWKSTTSGLTPETENRIKNSINILPYRDINYSLQNTTIVGVSFIPYKFHLVQEFRCPGRVFIVKDETGKACPKKCILIKPSSRSLVDGVSAKIIKEPYGCVRLYCNGTNWFTF